MSVYSNIEIIYILIAKTSCSFLSVKVKLTRIQTVSQAAQPIRQHHLGLWDKVTAGVYIHVADLGSCNWTQQRPKLHFLTFGLHHRYLQINSANSATAANRTGVRLPHFKSFNGINNWLEGEAQNTFIQHKSSILTFQSWTCPRPSQFLCFHSASASCWIPVPSGRRCRPEPCERQEMQVHKVFFK